MKSIEEMAQEIMLSLVGNYKSIELHCEEREEVVYVSIELAKDLDKALKAEFSQGTTQAILDAAKGKGNE